LLLCKPMQTHCGHLMCFACLQTLLEYVDLLYCYGYAKIPFTALRQCLKLGDADVISCACSY
jgi:hypothetical protein